MSEPWADARVEASLDYGDIDTELPRRLERSVGIATRACQRHFTSLERAARQSADKTGGHFERAATRIIAAANKAERGAGRSMAGLALQAQRSANQLADHYERAFDQTATRARTRIQQIRDDLRELRGGTITIDINGQEVRRQLRDLHRELQRFLTANPLTVRVALDTSRATTQLAEFTRDRDVNVNVTRTERVRTVGGGGGGRVGNDSGGISRLASGIGDLVGAGAKIAGIGAAVAAIGGAAGLAGGAVGGLAIGLAGLGAAGLPAIAALTVGLSGIKDAFTELGKESSSGGGAAADNADAIASAVDGVKSAEHSVQDAFRNSRDAQTDLTRARKDAVDQIEELDRAVEGQALTEKDASLSLREAREELAKGGFKSATAYERAQLRVEEAEKRVRDVQADGRDLAEQQQDAQKKGVEGSDEVVAAKQKIADSNYAVVESQRQLAAANRALASAQKPQGGGGADKAAEAMAKLAPEAQAFVQSARALGPAWTDLRKTTQGALFEGAAGNLTTLANAQLPGVKAGFVGIAGSMNGVAAGLSQMLSSGPAVEAVKVILAGVAQFVEAMGPGINQMVQGFLDFGTAAAPAMSAMGKGLGDIFGTLGKVFTELSNSGALTQLFQAFAQLLSGGVAPLLGDIVRTLVTLGNAVLPALTPLLASLGQAFVAIAPALGTLGELFAQTLTAIMPSLSQFIVALAEGMAPILPVLGSLLAALGAALAPLIPPLSQIIVAIGGALIQAVNALAPAVGPLATAFAAFVTAVMPILPVIAELVTTLITAFVPVLQQLWTAMGPVIEQLLDGLAPVFKTLGPIIGQVAGILGDVMLQAITALVPVLPPLLTAFLGLVQALAPLIPPLVTIAVQMLPVLMQVIVTLLPVITQWITMLTSLVNFIVPILIPVINTMGKVVGAVFGAVGDVIGFVINKVIAPALGTFSGSLTDAKTFVKSAIDGIGSFFSGLGSTVKGVWDGIVNNIKNAVGVVGRLLQKVPSWIPGGDSAKTLGNNLVGWAEGKANGDLIRGPGTGTSDDVPIMGSNGEFVVREKVVSQPGMLSFLRGVNSGRLRGLLPGFKNGGELRSSAQGVVNSGYTWGGWGNGWNTDCSGVASALVNMATGKASKPGEGERSATGGFSTWLAKMGLKPGLGPPGSLAVGWSDTHAAATLPGGENVEHTGPEGTPGKFGADAQGAADFPNTAFLPMGGDPSLGGASGLAAASTATGSTGGGDAGGASVGGGMSSFGNSGGSSGFNTAADAKANGITPVWVENWPGGMAGSGSNTLAASTTDTSLAAPAGAAGALSTSTSDLKKGASKQDMMNAVYRIGKAKGMSDEQILAAGEALLAESDGKNYANSTVAGSTDRPHDAVGSDGKSLGVMQQQSGMGWGADEQLMDPEYAIGRFFDEMKKTPSSGPASQQAQAVQRSAFADGSNYAAKQAEAQKLLDAAKGNQLPPVTPANPLPVQVTQPPAASTTAPTLAAPTSGSPTLAAKPALSSTALPPGQRRANAWVGEQDFGMQAQNLGISALKENVGDFLEPFGLSGVATDGIDRLIAAWREQEQRRLKVDVTVSGNQAPNSKVSVTEGMTPVTSTYRNG